MLATDSIGLFTKMTVPKWNQTTLKRYRKLDRFLKISPI